MKFKKLESGRSMVEMLGVLAIIGVLSVGGIAGYSLSMRRHRANQVVDFAAKNALIAYSKCQQKIINGEATALTECDQNKIVWSGIESDVGAFPAGLLSIGFLGIETNTTTGVDTITMQAVFDAADTAICQTVASVVGSVCHVENTAPDVYIKIKQN